MIAFCTITRLLVFLLLLPIAANPQSFAGGCDLKFTGSYRKAVKTRKAADGVAYTDHNGGKPITVKEWFDLVCGFDLKLHGKTIKTSTPAIKDIETVKVTLDGFLVGAKFERHVKAGDSADNDFHLEVSDEAKWQSRHVIIEVPPGPDNCEARKKISNAIKADGCRGGNRCILKTPVKIRVTGFVFLDATHGKTCKINRGLINNGFKGAEGAWEIHPVLTVEMIH